MGEQNLLLKRKFVIQSSLPLFIFIFIRYFDYRMISSICHLVRELIQRNFGVTNRIQDHPYLGPFIAAFISLACSLYGMTVTRQLKSMQMLGLVGAGEEVVIEEEITGSGTTFFMTFVLLLLLDDVETLRDFIIFTGILGLVVRLTQTTHLYYQNPILTLLGYKIYEFRPFNPVMGGCRDEIMITVCRTGIAEKKIVKWKYILDDVCLMHSKN